MTAKSAQPHSWRHAALLIGGVVFALSLVLYAATAAPTITVRHGGADGGELAAATLSGGVAHPPGYPTYLLLARLALFVFGGEPAARLAFLSALWAAGAAACTAVIVVRDRSTAHSVGWAESLAGGYAGLVLASGARFWGQAIIVEVYALHMLFLALIALLVLRWLRTAQPALIVAVALALGVGVGNHPTLLAAVPATLLAWCGASQRPRLSWRLAIMISAALVLGASVYGVLPVWAARGALPSWGDQRTAAGWWAHISSAEYAYLIGRVPLPQQAGRLGYAARDLLAQPGPVALGLAVWSLPIMWRQHRALLTFTATIGLASLGFAAGYGGADGDVYLLPWTWTWCVWAGLGVGGAARSLTIARRWRWLGAGVLAGAVLVPTAHVYGQLNLRADTSERDRIMQQLQMLPPNALLITHADADTFGVWYVQRALNMRSDVLVIDARLAQRPWYQTQVAHQLGTNESLCAALRTTPRAMFDWTTAQAAAVDGTQRNAALGCAAQ